MAPKSDSKRCKTRPYTTNHYNQSITTFFLGHHFHNHPFWVHTRIIPLLVLYTAHMSDKFTYYHRFLLAYQSSICSFISATFNYFISKEDVQPMNMYSHMYSWQPCEGFGEIFIPYNFMVDKSQKQVSLDQLRESMMVEITGSN